VEVLGELDDAAIRVVADQVMVLCAAVGYAELNGRVDEGEGLRCT
jgi:hypothetical protein